MNNKKPGLGAVVLGQLLYSLFIIGMVSLVVWLAWNGSVVDEVERAEEIGFWNVVAGLIGLRLAWFYVTGQYLTPVGQRD